MRLVYHVVPSRRVRPSGRAWRRNCPCRLTRKLPRCEQATRPGAACPSNSRASTPAGWSNRACAGCRRRRPPGPGQPRPRCDGPNGSRGPAGRGCLSTPVQVRHPSIKAPGGPVEPFPDLGTLFPLPRARSPSGAAQGPRRACLSGPEEALTLEGEADSPKFKIYFLTRCPSVANLSGSAHAPRRSPVSSRRQEVGSLDHVHLQQYLGVCLLGPHLLPRPGSA
jgi:hypothetical protein